MPEDLRPQFAVIQEILGAMGIGVVALQGFEADDLIGTLSRLLKERGVRTLILTGDKDDLQLVDDGISMLFTRKGISETVLFDPAGVKEYFGVSTEQVVDWKGLMGDSSDNIPGVPGVGEKTALKLLQEYDTLDNTLANAGNIKGKLGERLVTFADQARLSRKLATLTSISISLSLKDAILTVWMTPCRSCRNTRLNSISQRLLKRLAPRRRKQAPGQQTAGPVGDLGA